ncbi:MAG: hypothetical protein JNM88_20500 [Chitinophagaceae bacterium]|nr:hypothetical protein [Chitinophagaceae bacterium]
MNGLLYFFQDKDFGKGVQEIAYIAKSGDSVFLFSFGPGTTYSSRYKRIGCGFIMDYDTIQSLERESLLAYTGGQLIAQTRKFSEKRIKDFDLDGYTESLSEYIKEAKAIILNGGSPDEGKSLNEDIRENLAKRWYKL